MTFDEENMSGCHCVDYYRNQAVQGGNGLPVYSVQQGHGIFSSLFRMAVPLLKTAARVALPKLARSGVRAAKAVATGSNVKRALKRGLASAAEESIKDLARKAINTGKTKRKRQKVGGRRRGNIKKTQDAF